MKIFKRVLLAGIATCMIITTAWAQRNFDNVEIEVIDVADGVYMLLGAGGNIGVSVGEDGVLLVDDQFAPLTDKILAAIATITDKPVHFVINTHHHGDHTGGNENFGSAGAVIVAHDNVRTRMSAEQFAESLDGAPSKTLPVVTFASDITFHWNGEQIRVIHHDVGGAHTDGDAIIHFVRANVIHMGDTYFNGMYPFIDVNSGGNVEGLLRVLSRALEMANEETAIIPGHGPLSNTEELVAYRQMLAHITEQVGQGIRSGRSLESVIAQQPTADYDEVWAGGFISPERLVTAIYQSLQR